MLQILIFCFFLFLDFPSIYSFSGSTNSCLCSLPSFITALSGRCSTALPRSWNSKESLSPDRVLEREAVIPRSCSLLMMILQDLKKKTLSPHREGRNFWTSQLCKTAQILLWVSCGLPLTANCWHLTPHAAWYSMARCFSLGVGHTAKSLVTSYSQQSNHQYLGFGNE